MKKFLSVWLIDFVSLIIVDSLVSGIAFDGYGAIAATALVLVVLNQTVKPLLKILFLPMTIMTFGIFSFIINALVLSFAFGLSSGSFMSNFGTALITSILFSIISSFVTSVVDDGK